MNPSGIKKPPFPINLSSRHFRLNGAPSEALENQYLHLSGERREVLLLEGCEVVDLRAVQDKRDIGIHTKETLSLKIKGQ